MSRHQPTSKKYFEELKEWSARKIALIRRYVDGGTRILQEHGRVYYLDAFAGRGEYGKEGQTPVPGSPLHAAQLAQMYDDESYKFSLRCINIEEDDDNVADLRRVLSLYQRFVDVHHGTFMQHVDTALDKIGRNPVICFIDPFGVEGMDWEAVEKVIQKLGIADLWIRFDAPYVVRLDGFYNSNAPEAQAKRDLLVRTYGLPLDQIHHALRGVDANDRRRRAVALYQQQLLSALRRTKGESYTGTYELTSLEGEDKYHLVFACASKKALVLASNIVYNVEEEHQQEKIRYRNNKADAKGQLTLGFEDLDPPPEAIFNDIVNCIKDATLKHFAGQNTSREEIHAYLIENRFGQFGKRHMTELLRQLEAEGRVRFVSKAIRKAAPVHC